MLDLDDLAELVFDVGDDVLAATLSLLDKHKQKNIKKTPSAVSAGDPWEQKQPKPPWED